MDPDISPKLLKINTKRVILEVTRNITINHKFMEQISGID